MTCRHLLQSGAQRGVGLFHLIAQFLPLETRERGLSQVAPGLPEPLLQRSYILFQSVRHGLTFQGTASRDYPIRPSGRNKTRPGVPRRPGLVTATASRQLPWLYHRDGPFGIASDYDSLVSPNRLDVAQEIAEPRNRGSDSAGRTVSDASVHAYLWRPSL